MDPAMLANEAAFTASIGNAIYGQLIVNEPGTRDISYVLAEKLVTQDAGATFTLTLKPGLVYSDGTPLTADHIKFNWEHTADPAVASSYAANAQEITSMTAVDERTLKFSLRNPNAQFASEIYETSLNWIGKPEAIQTGLEDATAKPIGAGPFTLTEWRRQDTIVLDRNDNYFDKPRPHLDTLEIGILGDEEQRLDTVVSGGADIAQEVQPSAISQAEGQGLQVARAPLGGGVALVLNNRKAPFDDLRARRALSYALDLELIDDAVNRGTGTVPNKLFDSSSPYYSDITLHRHDQEKAQELLNELASDGIPLDFTITIYSSPAAQRMAESMQTQLSALNNINMKIRVIDNAQTGKIIAADDFQVLTSSLPETSLWNRLRGGAGNNHSGVDDPALNEALDEARRTTDDHELAAAYQDVQQRLKELVPVIFYTGIDMAAYANPDVGDLDVYGKGSLRVDQIWIQQ
ncbi:peptide/nickel transport system substrate-binding protein [Prauserella sediminis]|uniref:Peptide/nickel transport system substrate-binding protein n=1 Tax=Prauserella sediminis TaxID=577680 RepID=A0A839XZM7_9PSEU|nr:ABC transporter substrate-binding protein [Prauserella sediminis]MBB3665486.1 peptide/nickel transport system substrate-binding protein [Prauserella sediminis]